MLSRSQRIANPLKGKSTVNSIQVRELNLHEFQSKMLLDKYGATTQRGEATNTAAGARKIAESILAKNKNAELIVKAQIHAGGRGKGTFTDGFKGGVKVVKTAAEVEQNAKKMLGNTLVTIQTGAEGQKVNNVLINEGINIKSEKYFAILMDRKYQGPVIIASSQGGMNIEDVAHKTPEKIVTEPVDIKKGIQPEQTLKIAKALGFKKENIPAAQKNMEALYNLFIATDSTQVEINPLAEGNYQGQPETVFCVDAKLNFDDNAAFRQKDVYAMRDKSAEDPRDVRAEEAGLNFVGLDGNIGCLVNGAGLAMATMDIINLHGGKPANFLDVGGSATAPMVAEAFRILTSDKNVKAILVNIFGGIMKCDVIAKGIIEAVKEVGLKVPLVVRLEGTNVDLGKQLFKESGLPIVVAADLDDAAKKAVKAMNANKKP